jgi:hypothetical protein
MAARTAFEEKVVAMLSVRSVYSWSIVHGLSYEKGWA